MTSTDLSLLGAALTAISLGVVDHRTGRMPNPLTLGSLTLALTARWFLEGEVGALNALFGTLLVGGVPAALFVISRGEAIGGGDVKALGALGAWLGPSLGLEVELLSFFLLAGTVLILEANLQSFLPKSVVTSDAWEEGEAADEDGPQSACFRLQDEHSPGEQEE